MSCATGTGALFSTDCDDCNPVVFPGAAEAESATLYMKDADDDGYGDENPSAAVIAGIDCDDALVSINPGADEIVGDGIDQTCDGRETCYADADQDAFRSSVSVASSDSDCSDPGEATSAAGMDCLDSDGDAFPGAAELESATLCMVEGELLAVPRARRTGERRFEH